MPLPKPRVSLSGAPAQNSARALAANGAQWTIEFGTTVLIARS